MWKSASTNGATSLPEVAGSAALLVDPLSSGEMAKAITEILSDPTLADRRRGEGRARVQNYSWTDAVSKTVSVYRAALG